MKILTSDNKILRQTAKEVNLNDIAESKVIETINNMKIALDEQKFGVAIAAPQIGVGLRIFIVSDKVFDKQDDTDSENGNNDCNLKKNINDLVYINPKIIKTSKKKIPMREGCLSVPNLYGTVERYEKVTISYFDKNGREKVRGASGLLSQIFQHEIDHLNGIIYTDKTKNVYRVDENLNKVD